MPNNRIETRAFERPPSDGSELIPAEVQKNLSDSDNLSPDKSLNNGYTIDDEGIINSHAIEPDSYLADYPAPYQQRRYLVQGLIAIAFVAFIVWMAFAVS